MFFLLIPACIPLIAGLSPEPFSVLETVRAQQMVQLFLQEQRQQEMLTSWTISMTFDQNSTQITLIRKPVFRQTMFDKANKHRPFTFALSAEKARHRSFSFPVFVSLLIS